jgi:Xaa-Pro aminopeptidase
MTTRVAASGVEVFKDARKAGYLNPEGADRPLRSPVPHETLVAARGYRLGRIRERLARHDAAGILLYDPCNIRYALDSSNMQVWTLHNATRYALVLNGGPAILFEYAGCEHLADGLAAIDEVRVAKAFVYHTAGALGPAKAEGFAGEIAALVREHGGGNRRLAIDKVEPLGLDALRAEGLTILEGQELAEQARSIKSPDEIALMRWTIRVAEAAMARMYEASEPGATERELWAILHHENARSGGDWIETKILTSGPRTSPWFQECSDRAIGRGDMIGFDTDMVGPYGYCADLSRSWTCGHTAMTGVQRGLYRAALDQIGHNLALLRPGLGFAEFDARSWRIPERHRPYRYSVCLHGVGMADEWPFLPLHPDFDPGYTGQFEAGQVICVESLIGAEGTECVKLETQALITEAGAERLDSFPWEDA